MPVKYETEIPWVWTHSHVFYDTLCKFASNKPMSLRRRIPWDNSPLPCHRKYALTGYDVRYVSNVSAIVNGPWRRFYIWVIYNSLTVVYLLYNIKGVVIVLLELFINILVSRFLSEWGYNIQKSLFKHKN